MGLADSPVYTGQVVYRGFVDYKDLPDDTAQLMRKTVNFRRLDGVDLVDCQLSYVKALFG